MLIVDDILFLLAQRTLKRHEVMSEYMSDYLNSPSKLGRMSAPPSVNRVMSGSIGGSVRYQQDKRTIKYNVTVDQTFFVSMSSFYELVNKNSCNECFFSQETGPVYARVTRPRTPSPYFESDLVLNVGDVILVTKRRGGIGEGILDGVVSLFIL